MTEYGRGPGPQPWHPEDPLYGDPVYGGRPAAPHADPYGSAHPDPYATGQQPGAQQHHSQGQQPYPPQQSQQQYPPQQDPYGQQQDPYATGGWEAPRAAAGQGYGGGDPYGRPPGDPYGNDGYGNDGYGNDPYGNARYDNAPYGGDPYGSDPYGTGPQPVHRDPYAGGQAYPPPPPHQHGRQGQHGPGGGPHGGVGSGHPGHGPDPDTGWDAGADQGESAFFSDPDGHSADDHDEHDGDDDPDGRPGRAGRRGDRTRRGGTKRRSGCACLVVALVLGGGLGTVGYFGYEFYTSRFGAAPDYSGEGHGEVQVEIPSGSTHSDMGNILKKAGVVKSHDAFVAAAEENEKSLGIHAGIYTLHKEMSAAAAVEMMLDPASQGGLIIPEGKRASQIYELIDKKLEKKKGTTKKAAKSADLGLPSWAKGDPEGFLFPAKYSAGKETRPEDVLKAMVKRAKTEYRKLDLEAEAKKAGRAPREVIIVASLIQAEAQEDEDFGKVSRVIYNRLEQNRKLEFDSTINYAKGESKLNTSVEDTKFESPYNTYLHQGLPPGPIDNPGLQAIEAALEPTEGDWLYFVSVKPGDTRFTQSFEEHQKNVRDFNEYQRKKKENGG